MGRRRKLILNKYNKKWLKDNDIEMHSINNEGKFVKNVINDLNGEEIIGTFLKKNYKRLINKNLE